MYVLNCLKQDIYTLIESRISFNLCEHWFFEISVVFLADNIQHNTRTVPQTRSPLVTVRICLFILLIIQTHFCIGSCSILQMWKQQWKCLHASKPTWRQLQQQQEICLHRLCWASVSLPNDLDLHAYNISTNCFLRLFTQMTQWVCAYKKPRCYRNLDVVCMWTY